MKQSYTVPAFVSKLWELVEAHSTNDLICWSKDGCSLLVQDEQLFSKEVLPLYFKHSNMTSFVRQLNMYGFHKVVHVDAGLPKADGQVDCVEFQHENFRKAQPHLLGLIRRKISVSRGNEDGGQVSQVLVQVSHIRSWHDSSDLKLMALCRDNESLRRELQALRQKYNQQHKIIRKIIKFIINSVQSNRIKGCKRRLPMIDNSGEFESAPKYSRSLSVNSTSSLEEFPSLEELDVPSADVYTKGMVISDITQLLNPTPEPCREPVLEPPTGLSTLLSPASSALPSMELALSLLDEPEAQKSEEELSESYVADPLALIDFSLAAIRSCSSPSPDLDNFSKLQGGGPCSRTQDRSRNSLMMECSDILPSLLQLAQEASSLSFSNTTLPLELSLVL